MKKTGIGILLFSFMACVILAQGSNGSAGNDVVTNPASVTALEVVSNTSTAKNGSNKDKTTSKVIKRIDREEDKIIFRDSSGGVKKQIKLGIEKEKMKIKYNENNKTKVFNGAKKTEKHAQISADGKKTVISTDIQNVINENEMPDKYEPEIVGGGVEMLDENGNVKWTMNFEEGRNLGGNDENMVVSDNGVVAVQTSLYEEGTTIIYVLNSDGKVILQLPTEKEKKENRCCDFGSEFKLSADGKYLGITRDFCDDNSGLFFYNLNNGKCINLGKDYGVHGIDSKKMTAQIFIGNDYKTIDLKKEIGE
jgi:hypothetical protein